LDKKITGGDKLAKTKQKDSDTDTSGENYIEKTRNSVIECIGDICFTPEGKIIVKVDKDKDPACAKLCADYVLAGNEVIFEVSKKVGVSTDQKENKG